MLFWPYHNFQTSLQRMYICIVLMITKIKAKFLTVISLQYKKENWINLANKLPWKVLPLEKLTLPTHTFLHTVFPIHSRISSSSLWNKYISSIPSRWPPYMENWWTLAWADVINTQYSKLLFRIISCRITFVVPKTGEHKMKTAFLWSSLSFCKNKGTIFTYLPFLIKILLQHKSTQIFICINHCIRGNK